ncbi:MAG: hypothetical protein KC635_09195 [Myxococcales bacterium]|nr:hypothetical protein [Myxococcales bacterium]MCB9731926.1 hypothetical protein [Deltaproteobacteria bacterium]
MDHDAWRTAARAVRGYYVYAGTELVLAIESRPGQLLSVAPPPESGWTPPEHPWLHAASRSPEHEHRLRELVLASDDFEDFARRLVEAGYDLTHDETEIYDLEGGPRRVERDGAVVGVAWQGAGVFCTLSWQAEASEEVHFFHVALTAYDDDDAGELREAATESGDFAAFEQALSAHGMRLA